MSTALYISKLIELTRYQTDIIDELINELLRYREIDEIEALDTLTESRAIRKEIGED